MEIDLSREELKKHKGKIIPNCRIVEEGGVKKVVCNPQIEKAGERMNVCPGSIILRAANVNGQAVFELEDDGACAPEVVFEVDEYLSNLKKSVKISDKIIQPTQEDVKKVI